MQNSLSDYAGMATTYIVALLTIFGSLVADNYTIIVQVLGFILLVARLVQELPRAAKVIVQTFRRTVVKTDTATVVTTVETQVKKRG